MEANGPSYFKYPVDLQSNSIGDKFHFLGETFFFLEVSFGSPPSPANIANSSEAIMIITRGSIKTVSTTIFPSAILLNGTGIGVLSTFFKLAMFLYLGVDDFVFSHYILVEVMLAFHFKGNVDFLFAMGATVNR